MSANFPAQPAPVRTAEQRPGGLKLSDVYFTLFRHKWKILVLTLLGVLAAAGIWFFKGPQYQSEAKLLVRYVRDSRAVDASLGSQGDVKSPDSRGENIINSEIEILTSRDLALDVVDLLGPEKILAKAGGGTNRFAAAALILRGLGVDVPRRSSVIRVVFNHPDPEMAQTILRTLVQGYLRKHAEVHRAVGVFDEFLTKQTDAFRSQLNQTELELQKLKLSANVTSVEESKRMLEEQASRVRQDLMAAEAALAERRTILEKAQQAAGIAASPTNVSATATEIPLDPVQEQQYRAVLTRLESLRNRELELLLQFTPESQDVRQVRELIASTEKTKRELEAAEPRLLRLVQLALRANPGASAASGRTAFGAGTDLAALEAEVAALEARVRKLKEYQDEVRAEFAKINEVERAILDLHRQKLRQENQYLSYSATLEQARIDESLGASALANINVVQEASTPVINNEKTRKIVLGVLFGGLAAGVGLAFLIELVLDSRLKRPSDVEQKLNLPLFLSIPDFARNGYARALRHSQVAELPVGDPAAASGGDSPGLPAPARSVNPLRTFHEALRDRLIMYFELKEMHHKPKLVGVTGTHHGAGVSSIAAGLAETLSETGDGNVLLVDMNPEHGPSVYPFYRGKPGCGLSELFEGDAQRESAQVQENLYVVSLNGRSQGSRVGVVPRRFASLLPKMKASDYDYIIFDMPPVSQTSVTAKVSGLLDMTFLVVESERSNVEQTKRCAALLAESRANVTAVLNRHHNYLPEKLRTDV